MYIGAIVQIRLIGRYHLYKSASAYNKHTLAQVHLKNLPVDTLYKVVGSNSRYCQLKPLRVDLAIASYPQDSKYLNEQMYTTSNVETSLLVPASFSLLLSKKVQHEL